MLAPDRSRGRLVGVWCGRGVRLSAFGYGCAGRFLGFSWGGCAVVLAMGWDAVGWGCAVVLAMGWDAVGWGSAGSVLRSQVSSGEDRLLRCAQGFLWIASNARSGPIPRLPAGRVVWERGEAFSLWIRVRWEISGFFVGRLRCGSGDGVGCRGGLCGIGPALAGKLGGGSAFALCAGFFWIASNARSGSIPLPLAGRVVWERGEAFRLWIWVC